MPQESHHQEEPQLGREKTLYDNEREKVFSDLFHRHAGLRSGRIHPVADKINQYGRPIRSMLLAHLLEVSYMTAEIAGRFAPPIF